MAIIGVDALMNELGTSDYVETTRKGDYFHVPTIPMEEFIKEFITKSIEQIKHHYSRVTRVIEEDVANGFDSHIYKLYYKCFEAQGFAYNNTKQGSEELKSRAVVNAIYQTIAYFNIDNCIRIHYSTPRQISMLVRLTLKKLPLGRPFAGAVSEEAKKALIKDVIVGYIKDYINPRITFTDKDEELFNKERELEVESSGEKVMYTYYENLFVPIGITSDEPNRIKAYFRPEISGDDILVGDERSLFVTTNKERKFLFVERLFKHNMFVGDYKDKRDKSTSELVKNVVAVSGLGFNKYVKNVLDYIDDEEDVDNIKDALIDNLQPEMEKFVANPVYVRADEDGVQRIYDFMKTEYDNIGLFIYDRERLSPDALGSYSNTYISVYPIPSAETYDDLDKNSAEDVFMKVIHRGLSYFNESSLNASAFLPKRISDGNAIYVSKGGKSRLQFLNEVFGLDSAMFNNMPDLCGLAPIAISAYLNTETRIYLSGEFHKPYLTSGSEIKIDVYF